MADSTSSPPPLESAGHGCCVEGDCTPSTCMELPAGYTCGDCFHIARCKAIFGHVETDTYCDWFPRRFVGWRGRKGGVEGNWFPRRFVAKAPALAAENSWHRFCLQKDERPEMWPAKIKMIKTAKAFDGALAVMAATNTVHLHAIEGETYQATSNRYGAVCAVVDGKLLGVKPREFEIVTWQTERPASERFGKEKGS